MCFTIINRGIKVAEQDITVYKRIGNNGSGWMHNPPMGRWRIGELNQHEKIFPEYLGDRCTLRSGGFHSCKKMEGDVWKEISNYSNEKSVEMIIPKGARYYENDEEYFSSALIYVKDIINEPVTVS